jgi:hypothetical protein
VVFTAAEGIIPEEIVDDVDVELATCLPAGQEVSAVIVPAPVSGRQRGEKPDPQLVRGTSEVREAVTAPGGEKLTFCVGAGGFWQNHAKAPDWLMNTVAEASGLEPGQTAWDLYGGAGLLAAGLADRVGEHGTVWTVEGSPVTADDAANNFSPEGQARTSGARDTEVVVTRSGVEQALRRWATANNAGRASRQVAKGQAPAPTCPREARTSSCSIRRAKERAAGSWKRSRVQSPRGSCTSPAIRQRWGVTQVSSENTGGNRRGFAGSTCTRTPITWRRSSSSKRADGTRFVQGKRCRHMRTPPSPEGRLQN